MESTCLLGALAFLIARAVVGHEDGIWLETPEGSLETTEGQNITLKYRYEIDYPDGKRKFTIAIKKADSHERISFEAYIDLATGRMSNISNTLKGKLHVTSTLGCLTIVLANVTSQDSGSYFVDIIIEPILTKAALSHEIAITVHGPVSPPKVEPECSQDGSGILHIELDVPNLIESNVAENYTMHLPFPRCPTDGPVFPPKYRLHCLPDGNGILYMDFDTSDLKHPSATEYTIRFPVQRGYFNDIDIPGVEVAACPITESSTPPTGTPVSESGDTTAEDVTVRPTGTMEQAEETILADLGRLKVCVYWIIVVQFAHMIYLFFKEQKCCQRTAAQQDSAGYHKANRSDDSSQSAEKNCG